MCQAKNKNSTYIFNIISVLAAVVLLIAFYKIEEKAEEPIIPFSIFTRSITITNLVSFLASTVLIGADVYFPIYIQNVLGFSAKISGLALAPMSVAWLIASVVLGKLIVVRGAKFVVLVSNFILIVGTILLPTLGINSPILLVLIYVFIMGFGFGGAFTTLTIVIQESVGYNQRGAVTASNALVRTLGQTIGVSVFGGIFNLFIVKYFVGIGIKGVDPGNLYKASGYNSNATVEQIKFSLNSSLHVLFIILIAISVLSLIISIAMPKEEKSEI